MPYFVYAWIAAIVSGLLVVTAKLTSKHAITNPWLFNFLLLAGVLVFTLPPAMIFHAGMPVDWGPILLAAFFASLFNIFWIFSTYAFDVTVLTPLFNIRVVFALLIGIMFLGEKLSPGQFIFAGIILLAGMFATIDEQLSLRSFFKRSIAVGMMTMFFLAVNNAFIKISLMKNSLWTTNVWIALISTLLFLPTIPLFWKDLRALRTIQIIPVGLVGIFTTVVDITANIAYGVNLGISTLIINIPFSMIIAFLFSIFAPKLLEKHTLKVYAIRFTAAAVMIFSALQLTR